MANSLTEVIRKLEQQKASIERALTALREIEGTTGEAASTPAPATATATAKGTAKRGRPRGGMTPEGRRRLSEALKARWAARRGETTAAPASAPAKATRKGGMTPEGRRRLSEALKKRWAVKRANAGGAKRGRKQA
jgi:hypothetical protein